MEDQNVSAFQAYSSFIEAVASPPPVVAKKKPAVRKQPANLDDSFSKLSHDQMIAQLIGKKKQELKRKSEAEQPLEATPKKAAKRNKKNNNKAKSAPSSTNVSGVCTEEAASTATTSAKKLHPIKIHPKNAERLSMYLSKRTNKRNNKTVEPNTSSSNGKQSTSAAESELQKPQQEIASSDDGLFTEFEHLVQSTPLVGNGAPDAGKSSGKKSTNGTALKPSAAKARKTPSSKPVPSTPVPAAAAPSLAPPPSLVPLSNVSSIEAAKNLLSWIVHPTPIDEFLGTVWEQKPLLVDRKCPNYFSQLLSTGQFDRMLREQRVEFTKNLDVTSYVDGVRHTHNPEGRALPPSVWDFYAQGCSIRLLNPQTFLPVVHSLNATLQEYFQCMTGANVYLTPANSQGFAPHYDDIEAFVLQIEGRKHWKVYAPRTVDEQLPRDSSPNFAQSDIGQPILDVVLEAGDLLYFPRGFIHQASTVAGHHSMHITLSAYQKNAYADLLEQLVPAMLQSSIEQAVLLRRGLPANVWQCMGLVHSDTDEADAATAAARRAIVQQVRACLDVTMKQLEQHVDDAVDKLAVRFQHDALPPHLSASERVRSVFGTPAVMAPDGGGDGAVGQPLPGLETRLRLVRANVLRLVRHSADEFRVYYHTDNSREYHELEASYVEIGADDAPAVEYLVKTYPAFSRPSEWPIEDDEQAVGVAQDLWERGVLLSEDVLEL